MKPFIKLTFVRKEHENDDIYTFYFSPNQPIKHKAGQHGIFFIPGVYRPHPFSLSSAPEDSYITISTHTATGSRYKNKLLSLKVGASLFMLGPILNFTYLKDKKNYVFLAQGIGITPFHSMLLHAHTAHLRVDTTLIHVDSKTHTFQSTTEQLATHAYYPTNPQSFRKAVEEQNPTSMFYLSGSPRFIKATRELLLKQGVAKEDIKTDSFLGY